MIRKIAVAAARGLQENSPVKKGKEGGTMKRPVSLILGIILLITCSGCFWGWEHDGRGYDDRDRGGHDGDRHDDRRDLDDHR
jgi:hypothetical protein